MHSYYPEPTIGTPSLGNPAIQLFGNRLFSDQTVQELLVELLLMVSSPKRIQGLEYSGPLPTGFLLGGDKISSFEYAPRARLNLKLFSFLSASRLDSRHRVHREHHAYLFKRLSESIDADGNDNQDVVVQTIENLFLGFKGVGGGRTWCAQNFLPLSPALVACESIWKETQSRRFQLESWRDQFSGGVNLFDMNQHLFMARGGELLYLQICNALSQDVDIVAKWIQGSGLAFTANEADPKWLLAKLEIGFQSLLSECPALDKLADFIDKGLEGETADDTDGREDAPRWVSCGWCNTDSWKEGYQFAVELSRLLSTQMDSVDRIHLLELCCAMQALRTLARQAARSAGQDSSDSAFQFRLAVSAQDDKRPAVRRLSHGSLKRVEKTIFKALRADSVVLPDDQLGREKVLKRADKYYGGKLFIGLSKRIGFVVPKRGAGARFILTEQLLKLLVSTVVPPGQSVTMDTFKLQLERQHGLVIDAAGMDRASRWLDGQHLHLPADTDRWLHEMLEAAGYLLHLSDSCALVVNPAEQQDWANKLSEGKA